MAKIKGKFINYDTDTLDIDSDNLKVKDNVFFKRAASPDNHAVPFFDATDNILNTSPNFVYNDDKLGIGIANPIAMLDINSGGSPSGTPTFPIRVTAGSGNPGFIAERTDVSRFINLWTGSNGASLNFESGLNRLAIGTNTYANRYSTGYPTTEIMSILSSGNIGINNTSPGSKLHITTDIHSDSLQLQRIGSVTNTWKIGFWGDRLNIHSTTGSFSNNDTVQIDSGRLGINTVPSNSLHVNGVSILGNGDIDNPDPNARLRIPFTGSVGNYRTYVELQTVNANNEANQTGGGVIKFRTSTAANYGPEIGAVRRAGGAGELFFRTGGNDVQKRMVITDDGDIGIGTVTPNYKLHLVNNSSDCDLRVDRGSGYAWIQANANGGFFALNDSAGDRKAVIRSYADGSGVQAYFTSGRVGIGTASPLGRLQVEQAQNTNVATFTNPHLRLGSSSTTNNTGTTAITLDTSPVDNYGVSLAGLRAGTNGNPSFSIRLHSGTAVGTEVVRIANNGNFGIGTDSPSTKFQITDSNAQYQIGGSVTSGYTSFWKMDDTGVKFGGNSGSRDLQFQTNSATRLTIASGGAVSTAGNLNVGNNLTVSNTSTFQSDAYSNSDLHLPNANGGANNLKIAGNHDISDHNGTLTMYANRTTGAGGEGSFKIRSHANRSSYRTDLVLDANSRLGVNNVSPNYHVDVGGDVNVGVGNTYRIGGTDIIQEIEEGQTNIRDILIFNDERKIKFVFNDACNEDNTASWDANSIMTYDSSLNSYKLDDNANPRMAKFIPATNYAPFYFAAEVYVDGTISRWDEHGLFIGFANFNNSTYALEESPLCINIKPLSLRVLRRTKNTAGDIIAYEETIPMSFSATTWYKIELFIKNGKGYIYIDGEFVHETDIKQISPNFSTSFFDAIGIGRGLGSTGVADIYWRNVLYLGVDDYA